MKTERHSGTGMQLMLVEMIFAIGFFAVIAAVCVSIFSAAWQTAAQSRAKTSAVLAAESAAECFRHAGGNFEKTAEYLGAETVGTDTLILYYNDSWEKTADEGAYRLEISFSDAENGVTLAGISVKDGDGEIFALTAASAGEVSR